MSLKCRSCSHRILWVTASVDKHSNISGVTAAAKPSVYVDRPTIKLSDEERIRKIEDEWLKA